jgi:hypothetical protein
MIVSISQVIVACFGVAVCVSALWAFYTPDSIKVLINTVTDKEWGIVVLVVARLLLGLALIIAAPESRFELIFQILGGITLVAGIGLIFIGRIRLKIFVAWWFELFTPLVIRVWSLFAVAFGGFLIYGTS